MMSEKLVYYSNFCNSLNGRLCYLMRWKIQRLVGSMIYPELELSITYSTISRKPTHRLKHFSFRFWIIIKSGLLLQLTQRSFTQIKFWGLLCKLVRLLKQIIYLKFVIYFYKWD